MVAKSPIAVWPPCLFGDGQLPGRQAILFQTQ